MLFTLDMFEQRLEVSEQSVVRFILFEVYASLMRPSRVTVTRLSRSGRSSDVTQKRTACRPLAQVHPGAMSGAPAANVGVSVAHSEMWPIGYPTFGSKVEIIEADGLVEFRVVAVT